MECRWNQALQQVREIETRIEQRLDGATTILWPLQRSFAGLAQQLETVWSDPEADVRLKKRIIRTLIREVIADVDSGVVEVILVIHWYSETGDAMDAINAYRKAVETDPDYAIAYMRLALQYRRRRELSAAPEYYRNTCRLSEGLCREFGTQFQ